MTNQNLSVQVNPVQSGSSDAPDPLSSLRLWKAWVTSTSYSTHISSCYCSKVNFSFGEEDVIQEFSSKAKQVSRKNINWKHYRVVLREEAGSLARSHVLYMQELFTIKTWGFALNTLLIGRLTFSPLTLKCKSIIKANMDCLWKSHENNSGKPQPFFFDKPITN